MIQVSNLFIETKHRPRKKARNLCFHRSHLKQTKLHQKLTNKRNETKRKNKDGHTKPNSSTNPSRRTRGSRKINRKLVKLLSFVALMVDFRITKRFNQHINPTRKYHCMSAPLSILFAKSANTSVPRCEEGLVVASVQREDNEDASNRL